MQGLSFIYGSPNSSRHCLERSNPRKYDRLTSQEIALPSYAKLAMTSCPFLSFYKSSSQIF
jgi:hypothetical protein